MDIAITFCQIRTMRGKDIIQKRKNMEGKNVFLEQSYISSCTSGGPGGSVQNEEKWRRRYPHLTRWHRHIASFGAHIYILPVRGRAGVHLHTSGKGAGRAYIYILPVRVWGAGGRRMYLYIRVDRHHKE